MATSGILTLGDAIVSAVSTLWNPSAPSAISRVYQIPDSVNVKSIDGRQVWLFPVEYSDETANRLEDVNTYKFVFVVAEKYASAGNPPVSWVDDRVDWVSDSLIGWIQYGRDDSHPLLSVGTREIFLAEIAPVMVYEPDELIKRGMFWCEFEATFQELR